MITLSEKEIVVVTPHLTQGGAERVTVELVNYWIENGRKVSIIQLNPSQFGDAYTISKRVQLINFQTRTKNKLLFFCESVFRLVKELRCRPKTIVLALHTYAICVVEVASFFTKNSIIFSERNDPNNSIQNSFVRKIKYGLFNRADGYVFQTKEAMEFFPPKIQTKGTIIPNPINPEIPEMYHGTRRKAVVAVCRLDDIKQKNIPMLIDAFFKFNKEFPEYILEIYGRGNGVEVIKKLVYNLHLENKIHFKGFSHDIYKEICDCSMYVSASNYEGISNSMLEAMALGLPCVVTDCPIYGARAMIKNGENGILTPVGDSHMLYESMKKIAEDQSFASRLSQNAYRIREQYPIEIIGEKWLEIIDHI